MVAGAQRRRIALIDDHPVVREGLSRLIEQFPDLSVCGEAGDVDEALELLDRVRPDLAIVDISLKHTDGLDLVKQARVRWPAMAVLVLSMHGEEVYAERALRAGALGYVMKQEATDNLLTAIRQVLAGTVYVSAAVGARLLEEAVRGKPQRARARIDRLSDRELGVLRLIANGLSTKEIAARLAASPRAIESQRDRIRRKLHLANVTQVIQYAMQWAGGEVPEDRAGRPLA